MKTAKSKITSTSIVLVFGVGLLAIFFQNCTQISQLSSSAKESKTGGSNGGFDGKDYYHRGICTDSNGNPDPASIDTIIKVDTITGIGLVVREACHDLPEAQYRTIPADQIASISRSSDIKILQTNGFLLDGQPSDSSSNPQPITTRHCRVLSQHAGTYIEFSTFTFKEAQRVLFAKINGFNAINEMIYDSTGIRFDFNWEQMMNPNGNAVFALSPPEWVDGARTEEAYRGYTSVPTLQSGVLVNTKIASFTFNVKLQDQTASASTGQMDLSDMTPFGYLAGFQDFPIIPYHGTVVSIKYWLKERLRGLPVECHTKNFQERELAGMRTFTSPYFEYDSGSGPFKYYVRSYNRNCNDVCTDQGTVSNTTLTCDPAGMMALAGNGSDGRACQAVLDGLELGDKKKGFAIGAPFSVNYSDKYAGCGVDLKMNRRLASFTTGNVACAAQASDFVAVCACK